MRTLARIVAPHFVCGIEMDGDKCVASAPITKYMVGKSRDWIRDYCRTKGWRIAMLAACWLVCGAGCVKETPPPVQFVPQLQFVPVPTELTEPLQCYQRADGTVREYIRQAEHNTAACEKANADRAATATLKAPDQ